MSRLYLITGFLGAGKTTFLKNFIKEFSQYRIHLIINEFGKEGVDGELMKELGMALDEINNGSIFCSCRLDRFEEVLQKAQSKKPDVIIVEASGLSNPMNVRKILNQQEKFADIEYKGSICLVDAVQFLKVYETAVVVKKQLAVSDLILINKTDLVSREQIEQIKAIINRHRPFTPVFETVYGKIETGWLAEMSACSTAQKEEPILQTADITLKKYLLRLAPNQTPEKLKNFIEMFMDDTYRVKGFAETTSGLTLINCVGSVYQAALFAGKPEHANELVVLSGNGLPAGKSIKKAMQWYPDVVKELIKGN